MSKYNELKNLLPKIQYVPQGKKISGKKISTLIREGFSGYLPQNHKVTLAVLNTQTDPSSNYYVQSQKRIFNKNGLEIEEVYIDPQEGTDLAIEKIKALNIDPKISGIQAMIPFPKGFDQQKILDSIDPLKDVDCQTTLNLGAIMTGYQCLFYPNTALAVKVILHSLNKDVENKKITIINRSNVVGKPLSMMLIDRSFLGNATPTICHSRTPSLKQLIQESDIVISAIGKPHFLNKDWLKNDSILIDVGINVIESDGQEKVVGDFDYESCLEKCQYITPVPNGVGSVTTSLLMYQTLIAYYLANQNN